MHTFVSGVGNDSNPCTRTAPCLTWQGAEAKTLLGGEIDALDPADYGPLNITEALTIDGGGGQAATIFATSGNSGIVVSAPITADVTIRNVRIQGNAGASITNGTGIYLNTAGTLHIEHCFIAGMASDGIFIYPENQPGSGAQVFIDDTNVQDSGASGVYVASQVSTNVHVTISNSRFKGNSSYGVWVADYSRVTLRNSESSGNFEAGYFASANNGNTILSMIDSVATNNLNGGVIAGGGAGISTVRIANMGVFNNVTGLTTNANGAIVSFGNNNNSGSGTPTGSIAQD
jgi:hypothetical protein